MLHSVSSVLGCSVMARVGSPPGGRARTAGVARAIGFVGVWLVADSMTWLLYNTEPRQLPRVYRKRVRLHRHRRNCRRRWRAAYLPVAVCEGLPARL